VRGGYCIHGFDPPARRRLATARLCHVPGAPGHPERSAPPPNGRTTEALSLRQDAARALGRAAPEENRRSVRQFKEVRIDCVWYSPGRRCPREVVDFIRLRAESADTAHSYSRPACGAVTRRNFACSRMYTILQCVLEATLPL
jgi:hypothetical protein